MTSVSDKLATQVYSQTLSVTKCLVFKCSLCVKKKKFTVRDNIATRLQEFTTQQCLTSNHMKKPSYLHLLRNFACQPRAIKL